MRSAPPTHRRTLQLPQYLTTRAMELLGSALQVSPGVLSLGILPWVLLVAPALQAQIAVVGSAAVGAAAVGSAADRSGQPSEEVALTVEAAARGCAEFLRGSAIPHPDGWFWPVSRSTDVRPPIPAEVGPLELERGTAGTVIFFVEAYRVFGKATYLQQVVKGCETLLTDLRRIGNEVGLYSGTCGKALALFQGYAVTRNEKYNHRVREFGKGIVGQGEVIGDSVEWSSSDGICGGNAGVGLFLLRATEDLFSEEVADIPFTLQFAEFAADRMMTRLNVTAESKPSTDVDSTLDISFYTGHAGSAYFLASVFLATGKHKYREGATHLGHRICAQLLVDGGGCRPRGSTGKLSLEQLGWQHGLSGYATCFLRLFEATGDEQWRLWMDRCVKTITAADLPARIAQGCPLDYANGAAGIGSLLLGLHAKSGNDSHLRLANAIGHAIASRGEKNERHVYWRSGATQQVQLGYLHGQVGIGMFLLRLHEFQNQKRSNWAFPDSPFWGRAK